MPFVSLLSSPYWLLLLTTLFWSGNFVLGRAVHEIFSPIGLSFWRWSVALLLLLPFTLHRLSRQWTLLKRHWKLLTLLSILGVVNFNTFVYTGLQYTTATNAVLMISTMPVIIVTLSFLLLRSTVTSRQLLGITLSLLGVAVIVTRGELTTLLTQRINQGDGWIMGAVLSWALYSVCLRWRPQELDAWTFLTVIILIGVIFLALLYGWDLHQGHSLEIDGVVLGSIAYVALFPSLLAYLFWNRAVQELGANRAGQFLHLMPVFGAIQSMVFLGERLHPFHMFGVGLIGLGIYLTTVQHRHKI